MTNIINDKFYDFINMYNAIIKHCTNKQRTYDVKLSHINDTLYFKVIDKESKTILHNDNINCTKEESKLIYNMITSEFILNHNLKYAAYLPMDYNFIPQKNTYCTIKNIQLCTIMSLFYANIRR